MNFTDSFNKTRFELLGVAALGILLVHSRYYNQYLGLMNKITSYGGVGVCMFVFISGLGLYRSLKYHGGTDLKRYYKRRFTNVLVPYLLIASIWYLIKWVLFEHNIVAFLYELSTLSFWGNHQGAWYVAMLIPLYLVYPAYYKWVEAGRRGLKTSAIVTALLSLAIWLSYKNTDLYNHLSNIISSYMIFVIGNYFGEALENRTFSDRLVALTSLGIFCTKAAIKPLNNIIALRIVSNAALGIILVIFITWLLSWLKAEWLHKILSWLGSMSLELYLTNIFLSQAYDYFHIEISNGYIAYGLIVVVEIGMSCCIHKLLKRA